MGCSLKFVNDNLTSGYHYPQPTAIHTSCCRCVGRLNWDCIGCAKSAKISLRAQEYNAALKSLGGSHIGDQNIDVF